MGCMHPQSVLRCYLDPTEHLSRCPEICSDPQDPAIYWIQAPRLLGMHTESAYTLYVWSRPAGAFHLLMSCHPEVGWMIHRIPGSMDPYHHPQDAQDISYPLDMVLRRYSGYSVEPLYPHSIPSLGSTHLACHIVGQGVYLAEGICALGTYPRTLSGPS